MRTDIGHSALTGAALILDGTVADDRVLGGKGAALDRLLAWDLPVPPTGAITTDAYRSFVEDHHISEVTDRIRSGATVTAAEVDEAFIGVGFDDETAGAIVAAARRVGDGHRVAVRSSATVEDLAGSSFAGQYRSVLDVDPDDGNAVLDAVRLVFASLWHPAPCAYRRAFGIDDEHAAMSAVVMRMVPARRAGVVFTVDPAGTPNAARIEAVEGIGESLVSGQRTPDAWVLDRDQPADGQPCEVTDALRLALVAERRSGAPQDVEWAWDGARVWVVQARPITVLEVEEGDGFDDQPTDEDLTTAGIGEMLPGVLPPLLWEIDSHLVEEAFRHVLDDLGVLKGDVTAARYLIRRIRGRAALDFTRLQAMARAIPGGAADEIEEQYFGSRRPGRPAVSPKGRGSRVASLVHDLRVMAAGRHNNFEGETVIEAVRDIARAPLDLASCTDQQLLAYRLALLDLAVRTMSAELGVAASATSAYRRVELLLIPHLGGEQAGREAERLTTTLGVTATPDAEASAAVFGGPTWRELGREPAAIRRRRAREDDREALDDLEARLRRLPSWGHEGLRAAVRTRALRRTVDDAVVLLRRREHVKAALLRLGGEARRVHDELAHRLVERGLLTDPRDVELLTSAELFDAIVGQPIPRTVLSRRRRWRLRYETEPPLPVRFTGRPEAVEVELPAGGRIDGWAASPGRFTGTGQVVRDAKGPFDSGKVLVAEATDASWSPLFVDAGAVVLERGGPLSHAAILARELGVPAVLNVPGATHFLSDAEMTVDGDAGVVVVHDAGLIEAAAQ